MSQSIAYEKTIGVRTVQKFKKLRNGKVPVTKKKDRKINDYIPSLKSPSKGECELFTKAVIFIDMIFY